MDLRDFQNKRFEPGDIPWERLLAIAPLAIVVTALVLLVFNSFYTVAPNEMAVVLRFGEYSTTQPPGLHFRVPLVDRVLKVGVEEHSVRLPFGAGAGRPISRFSEDETLMLTGDLNAASVEWTVQWKVTEPKDYLFRFYNARDPDNAERVIITVAQAVMNRLVGDYSIDEVLTEKRGEIAADALNAMQTILNDYQCGVSIRDLQMQRVTPPEKVKPSFDMVNASIQRRDRLENEANKERNQLIPAALAERDKMIREAEGYRDRRRAESNGEIRALQARFRAYEKAPQVTRQRLYLEAMQLVLEQVGSKTILDSDLKQLLPIMQLNEGANP